MAKTDLTAERLRKLLHYDPVHGTWAWKSDQRGGVKAGDAAGCAARSGYRSIGIGNKTYRTHRLAWLYMTGAWPAWHIDHIDGNTSNCAWSNLRDVPRSVNMQNRHRADVDSKTGVLGVTQLGTRWKSEIGVNGRRIHLGTFDTKDLAHAAYLAAKRELHTDATIARLAGQGPEKNGHPIGRSGLRGVRKIGHRWAAHIYHDGKQKHLGMFASKEEAHRAHLEASALLGHAGERVADKYADPRGIEPVRVKVG